MNRLGSLSFLFSIAFVLSACRSSSPTPPPYGFLDAPTPETTVTGPTFEVRGWVLDATDAAPSLSVFVDGQIIETKPQRVARKDVCSANPAIKHCENGKPGFIFTLNTAPYSDGFHTISFDAANKDGSSATVAKQKFAVKKKTCLVLSVGEARGVAHIGAIDALKDAGIKLDCVAGNSMGALVGGLYVTAPETHLKFRFQRLMATYKEKTMEDMRGRAALGALIGGILTGGLGAAVIAGAAGAVTVEQIDRERFTRVLDSVYEHATIEDLPVPFSTSYQTLDGNGMGPYTTARKGPLATAVSCSANNALIFKQDLAKAKCLDPRH